MTNLQQFKYHNRDSDTCRVTEEKFRAAFGDETMSIIDELFNDLKGTREERTKSVIMKVWVHNNIKSDTELLIWFC